MRTIKRLLVFIVMAGWLSGANFIEKVGIDIHDTVATGVPIALVAAVWWAIANRVPTQWADLPDPAASFIRTTWKQQGFLEADTVDLKEIPHDSLFARVIMYTQELPNALGVGGAFRTKIELLLAEKEELSKKLLEDMSALEKEECIERDLCVERQLNECRFVCGHERVHKEEGHTFRMLIIQCLAPFIVYSLFKHTANFLEAQQSHQQVVALLRKSGMRSLCEMLIFWCSAHWYERKADKYASDDPEVILAGIDLFEKAHQKIVRSAKVDTVAHIVSWFLKYTHPTSSERIAYLKESLKKAEADY